jgi:hypothetical protein
MNRGLILQVAEVVHGASSCTPLFTRKAHGADQERRTISHIKLVSMMLFGMHLQVPESVQDAVHVHLDQWTTMSKIRHIKQFKKSHEATHIDPHEHDIVLDALT